MIFIIIILGLVLDQVTKFFILKKLIPHESIPIIKNIFHLTLTFNKGAAFGLFKGWTSLFIITSITTILLIAINLKKNYKTARIDSSSIALGLILSGALGNLIDRLRFSFVVDFLDFRIWPVFNIADSLITIGAILLAFNLWKAKRCIR